MACRCLEHAFPLILRRERYLRFKLKATQDQGKRIHTLSGWNLQNALRWQIAWSMVLGRGYSYQPNAFHERKRKEGRKEILRVKEHLYQRKH